MAKFQDKHLKLRDNQRAYFGDSDDCSIWFDGSQLRVSCTVSGVYPTQSYHLTTRQYVDELEFLDLNDTPATYSGFGDYLVVVNAGETGLTFTSVSGLNILMDHGLLDGLGDDDHLQYVRADGGVNDTRGFTATVSGIYPTAWFHLTTKQYVDERTRDHRTGRVALALDDDRKSVTFATPMSDTNYSLSVIMRNFVDDIKDKSIYAMIITGTTVSGFDVLFSGDIDSNNYYLDYVAASD